MFPQNQKSNIQHPGSNIQNSILKTLLQRAGYSSTGILVARMSTAFAAILIARAVGPGSFGIYAAVWALIVLSASLTEIGLSTGIKRDGARNANMLPTLLGNAFLIKSVIGILALALAFLLSPAIIQNTEAKLIYLPLALAGFASLTFEPFYAGLQVLGKQRLVAILDSSRGLTFLLAVILCYIFGYQLQSMVWCQGIIYLVFFLITVFFAVIIASIKVEIRQIVSQISGSLVYGISGMLYSIYTQVPILLLAHFQSEENVGFFAVAMRFVSLTILAGTAAGNNAFLPSLFDYFSSNRERFRNVCSTMQNFFLATGVILSAVLFVLAEPLVVLLQGEEYQPAIQLLRILCWTVALSFAALALDVSLTASDRMKSKIKVQAFAMLFILVAGYFLIQVSGIIGASFLVAFNSAVVFLLFFISAKKAHLFGFSNSARLIIPSFLTILIAIVSININAVHFVAGLLIFIAGSFFIWKKIILQFFQILFGKPLPYSTIR